MATQTQTQDGVEHEQPRQRRRAKERPDALANQLSKLPEIDSPTAHNHAVLGRVDELDSTLVETAQAFARIEKAMWGYLAEACRKLDHEEFKLHAVARSHGLSTVSDLAEFIEETIESISSVCFYGPKNPEAYLRNFETLIVWGEAEAIFTQSMAYEDDHSEPHIIGKQFVRSLNANSNRHHVLITDLLPRLVDLNQIDYQFQVFIRKRWAYIDMIMERWYRDLRKDRCKVPDWQELSAIFKHHTAKEEGELPARLSHISSALWLSLPVFLTTVPTAALGWQYSPHQRGTTQDADFWFLIQSSCMTILGFATLAIPIWRTEAFSVKARYWVWGLLIAASLCVLLSPLVYIFGPTEWSQFMSIVAGIVQVFLTLQVALIADSAGKSGGKSGKKDK